MEQLQYIIEDSTIAYLLGVNNFNNDESAILELVKNAYDAGALIVKLAFSKNGLVIEDDGCGMDADDIKKHWMHVGKSDKENKYEIVDVNKQKRILSGSKGIGRFAIARLGDDVTIQSYKIGSSAISWTTNWENSMLFEDVTPIHKGTIISISGLREKWTKKRINDLAVFLGKTYNDSAMQIVISSPDGEYVVKSYFKEVLLGRNCLTSIALKYDSTTQCLFTAIESDEFVDEAEAYCMGLDLHRYSPEPINMVNELGNKFASDLSFSELKEKLEELGDFSARFYFNLTSSKVEMEKFLYKYDRVPDPFSGGVILYRNSFSISAYEGKKDWLGFGMRSRKSPAAATHPTGSWRVRENQISGCVNIDKRENSVLRDLSNRQGIEETISYQLFVEILLTGVKEFERYRQAIIRKINVKNEQKSIVKQTPMMDRLISDPKSAEKMSQKEVKQLVSEIKTMKTDREEAQRGRDDVEKRYKYDVRILNVLSTIGLKAASIAHEMQNDSNDIAENVQCIVDALIKYDMWDELNMPDRKRMATENVPYLLSRNQEICEKILEFMDTMLAKIKKSQFDVRDINVYEHIRNIIKKWEKDYSWISISLTCNRNLIFHIPEDILPVILDNLILNSIQQNDEKRNKLTIEINIRQIGELLVFTYKDDGVGLNSKYVKQPRKILEVTETSRADGHGLGMWMVNNTAVMSGGAVGEIVGTDGFFIEFSIGGKI